MAKFDVTFYYHTSVTVEVEAENEEEALELAVMEVDDEKYNEQILGNLDEDNDPDVTPA